MKNENLTKFDKVITPQDYVKDIFPVLRMDTSSFRDKLSQTGNQLLKVDRIMQKIARLARKKAARTS